MMKTVVMRRMDELGRVCLPEEARAALNLSKTNAVEISWEGDAIVIKKAKPSCRLCGSEENVHERLGLCKGCIDKIKTE
ncbi:MAG: AbrB/MazE/SpoVT family DNA-binding domain-containing protein [Eubacterium sp.]|nr:AbrB/MazE/SpoVT family DNA-binding domain-containing protein [Eubacterium sp.]